MSSVMPAEHKDAAIAILNHLERDEAKYAYFKSPAKEVLLPAEIDIYEGLVSDPRDLVMIREKLIDGAYDDIIDFKYDVDLMFSNCKKFCKQRYQAVYDIANNYHKMFRNQMDRALAKLGLSGESSADTAAVNLVRERVPRESALEAINAISKMNHESTLTGRLHDKVSEDKKTPNRRKQTTAVLESPEGTKRTGGRNLKASISSNLPFEGYEIHCEKIWKEISTMSALAKLLASPVDPNALPDYSLRIPIPVDYSLVRQRMLGRASSPLTQYKYLEEFALDMRRIVGNCLRYNYTVVDMQLRREAVKILLRFEKLWSDFQSLMQLESLKQPLPELKVCLDAFMEVVKTPSTGDNNGVVAYAIDGFINPVAYFLDENGLSIYQSVVKQPMDMGTLISKICEADYTGVDFLKADLNRIASNCDTYWTKFGGKNEAVYIHDAKALEAVFLKVLSTFKGTSAPASNINTTKARVKAVTVAIVDDIPPPPVYRYFVEHVFPKQAAKESSQAVSRRAAKFLQDIFKLALEEVKNHYLLSLDGSFKIYSALPFIKAVDITKFPDYDEIIPNPMNILRMEKNLACGRYSSVPLILADMELIRQNAHTYNTGDANVVIRNMADTTAAFFRCILKTCLLELQSSDDYKLVDAIFSSDFNDSGLQQTLLEVAETEEVQKYFAYFDAEANGEDLSQVATMLAAHNVVSNKYLAGALGAPRPRNIAALRGGPHSSKAKVQQKIVAKSSVTYKDDADMDSDEAEAAVEGDDDEDFQAADADGDEDEDASIAGEDDASANNDDDDNNDNGTGHRHARNSKSKSSSRSRILSKGKIRDQSMQNDFDSDKDDDGDFAEDDGAFLSNKTRESKRSSRSSRYKRGGKDKSLKQKNPSKSSSSKSKSKSRSRQEIVYLDDPGDDEEFEQIEEVEEEEYVDEDDDDAELLDEDEEVVLDTIDDEEIVQTFADGEEDEFMDEEDNETVEYESRRDRRRPARQTRSSKNTFEAQREQINAAPAFRDIIDEIDEDEFEDDFVDDDDDLGDIYAKRVSTGSRPSKGLKDSKSKSKSRSKWKSRSGSSKSSSRGAFDIFGLSSRRRRTMDKAFIADDDDDIDDFEDDEDGARSSKKSRSQKPGPSKDRSLAGSGTRRRDIDKMEFEDHDDDNEEEEEEFDSDESSEDSENELTSPDGKTMKIADAFKGHDSDYEVREGDIDETGSDGPVGIATTRQKRIFDDDGNGMHVDQPYYGADGAIVAFDADGNEYTDLNGHGYYDGGYYDEDDGDIYYGEEGEEYLTSGENQVYEEPVMVSKWELACESVLQTLEKHPFISLRSLTIVGNFHVPVLKAYPQVKERYLAIISEPMDLNTLRNLLYQFEIRNSEEFFRLVTMVFQNAVDFSEPSEEGKSGNDKEDDEENALTKTSNKWRTEKFRHLVRYCQWLALETLLIAPSLEDEVICAEVEVREIAAKAAAKAAAEVAAQEAEMEIMATEDKDYVPPISIPTEEAIELPAEIVDDDESTAFKSGEDVLQLGANTAPPSDDTSQVIIADKDAVESPPAADNIAIIAAALPAPMIQRPLKFDRLQEKLSERKVRESMISSCTIDRLSTGTASGIIDCDRLLKEIRKTKNKSERRQLDFFLLPLDEAQLTDYYVYVRKPMDLSTVKFKLDGTLPNLGTNTASSSRSEAVFNKIKQHSSYKTYEEFLTDIRRIFENAIRYNTQHKDDDTVSSEVYAAAIAYRTKVEELIAGFTLKVVDKIERLRIKREEDSEREAWNRSYQEKIDVSAAKFEAEEREKLLQEDEYFAADLDAESRKNQTNQDMIAEHQSKQLEMQKLMEAKALLRGSDATSDLMDLGLAMEFNPDFDIQAERDRQAILMESVEAKQMEDRRLQALAEAARLPLRFVKLVEAKKRVRDAAWKKWEPIAIKKAKPMTESKASPFFSFNNQSVHSQGNGSPILDTYSDTDNEKEKDKGNQMVSIVNKRPNRATSLGWPSCSASIADGAITIGPSSDSSGWIEVSTTLPAQTNVMESDTRAGEFLLNGDPINMNITMTFASRKLQMNVKLGEKRASQVSYSKQRSKVSSFFILDDE